MVREDVDKLRPEPEVAEAIQRHPREELNHLDLERDLELLEVGLGLAGDEDPRPQADARGEAPQEILAERVERERHALATARDVDADQRVLLGGVGGGAGGEHPLQYPAGGRR
jgi:hypothetical protein